MPSNGEVPDPTDWIGTPLSSLSSLESSLQCHVCKELIKTPMITSCSHTFCSLCIRRCLSQDGRCPACRSGDQESKLRRNWAVEECVSVYEKQRENLLNLARMMAIETRSRAANGIASDERSSKRRRTQRSTGTDTTSQMPMRATRSQSRMAIQASQESMERIIVEDSEDDGGQYDEEDFGPVPGKPSPKAEDGLVACPICNRRMKEEAVDPHLDQCDGGDQSLGQPAVPTAKRSESTSVAYSVPSPTKARQRLGALNYSLLSEAALRKKLVEIGIPSYGPKLLMQRRHIEWMNLWNASCDSTKPMTKRQLLRELDIWERTQGRQIANAQGPSGVMAKDFDAEAWSNSNKDDFTDLIKKARQKANNVPPIESKDGKLDQRSPPQQPSLAHSPDLDHSSTLNGIVDSTSLSKTVAEDKHSQSSQMKGVTA